jgi:hypothetical protein
MDERHECRPIFTLPPFRPTFASRLGRSAPAGEHDKRARRKVDLPAHGARRRWKYLSSAKAWVSSVHFELWARDRHEGLDNRRRHTMARTAAFRNLARIMRIASFCDRHRLLTREEIERADALPDRRSGGRAERMSEIFALRSRHNEPIPVIERQVTVMAGAPLDIRGAAP